MTWSVVRDARNPREKIDRANPGARRACVLSPVFRAVNFSSTDGLSETGSALSLRYIVLRKQSGLSKFKT